MKSILFSLLPLFLIPTGTNAGVIPSRGGFTYIEVSPLYDGETNAIKFKSSFSAFPKGGFKYSISVLYDGYSEEENIYSLSTDSLSINATINFKLSHYLDLTLICKVYSGSGGTLANVEFDVPVVKLDVGLIRSDPFKYVPLYGYVTYTPEEGVKTNREKITCTGFSNMIDLGSYSRIDFSKFRIKHESDFKTYASFPVSSITILLSDKGEYFRHLFNKLNYDGYLTIPLVANYDKFNNDYYLSLGMKMYVDPLTLKMSIRKLSGYVATSYLYFPDGYLDEEEIVQQGIVFENVGFSHCRLVNQFSFVGGNKLFGSCYDSEFCVTTSSSEPDYDLGKVYEH